MYCLSLPEAPTMQIFITHIPPVRRNGPPDIPSPASGQPGEPYAQFHSSRVQRRCGNDGDRVETFSRSAGWIWTSQHRRLPDV
jgi:hypothetical protein